MVAKLLNKFRSDNSGSIMPLFGVCIFAIFAAAGAAIDYSRAASARTQMQAALDATALMLAKEAAALTEAQLAERVQQVFLASLKNGEAKNLVVVPKFTNTSGNNKITLDVAGTVDTTVFQIFGRNIMNVRANSEVLWGVRRLELALALDNTGSMLESGKLDALKTATHDLIDTLTKASKKKDDIRISIIPFTTFVNVDPKGNQKADWIDFSDWTGFDSTGTETGLSTEWVNKKTGKKWTGCVTDRTQPYDAQDTAPTGGDTLYLAVECINPGPLMALTSQWKKLHTKVDEMIGDGTTNVSIGLAWAWHSLTGGMPLTEGSSPAPDLDKVIVLLTDGDNTENRWSTNASDIDKRTQATCDNIKKENIKVYTIRVIAGNASLLRSCASSDGMYYEVQQASQLNAVFQKIANSLASLRIAK